MKLFIKPKVLNLDPCSAMNKAEEIKTFIEEENIGVAFISESHEGENKTLEDTIKLPTLSVISNLYQQPTSRKVGNQR